MLPRLQWYSMWVLSLRKSVTSRVPSMHWFISLTLPKGREREDQKQLILFAQMRVICCSNCDFIALTLGVCIAKSAQPKTIDWSERERQHCLFSDLFTEFIIKDIQKRIKRGCVLKPGRKLTWLVCPVAIKSCVHSSFVTWYNPGEWNLCKHVRIYSICSSTFNDLFIIAKCSSGIIHWVISIEHVAFGSGSLSKVLNVTSPVVKAVARWNNCGKRQFKSLK